VVTLLRRVLTPLRRVLTILRRLLAQAAVVAAALGPSRALTVNVRAARCLAAMCPWPSLPSVGDAVLLGAVQAVAVEAKDVAAAAEAAEASPPVVVPAKPTAEEEAYAARFAAVSKAVAEAKAKAVAKGGAGGRDGAAVAEDLKRVLALGSAAEHRVVAALAERLLGAPSDASCAAKARLLLGARVLSALAGGEAGEELCVAELAEAAARALAPEAVASWLDETPAGVEPRDVWSRAAQAAAVLMLTSARVRTVRRWALGHEERG
jgi:hypothetical protein